MKIINKFILPLVCAAGILCSCEDHRRDYLDEYSTMVYFRNGGEQDITLYSVGENTVYDIPICKSGSDLKGTAVARVAVMDQSQLDIYNMVNGTAYQQMPPKCYEFVSPTAFDFASIDPYQVARVEMKTDAIRALQEADATKRYVLALQVYADKTVSSQINRLILRPTIDIPHLSFYNEEVEIYYYDSSNADVNNYQNQIQLDMENRWNFTCTVAARGQEWLDEYNQQNGTSYQLLSPSAYTLPAAIEFTEGSNRAPFEVSIDRTNFSPFIMYALPLQITGCSKPELAINESSTYMVVGRVDPDTQVITLTESMLSSPYTLASDGGGIPALIDGETNTYWHSYYSGQRIGDPVYGYYIDIALQSPLSAVRFSYATRHNNGNAVPTHIRIGVSNDGQTWTVIGEVSSGLPMGTAAWGYLPLFASTESFTRIRFGIAESGGGAGGDLTVQVATSASVALSELTLEGV